MNDDLELVQRCLLGRESAYRAFVERFQALIYGVCVRMVGDRHEAEDIAQEVFVRAIRGLKKWDPDRPLRPWLLAIAANRCRTHLGKARQRPVARELVEDVADPRIVDQTSRELQNEIRAGVAALRPEYQQVFLLFHEQGLSYDEMSEMTGKPIGTLKTWLHRTRAELLAYLRGKGLVAPEVNHDLSGV